jgi:hypothetical protein
MLCCCNYSLFSHELSLIPSAFHQTHHLPSPACIQAQLEGLKFFAKPKLALDSVGGHSVKQIADMLEEARPRALPPIPHRCPASRRFLFSAVTVHPKYRSIVF